MREKLIHGKPFDSQARLKHKACYRNSLALHTSGRRNYTSRKGERKFLAIVPSVGKNRAGRKIAYRADQQRGGGKVEAEMYHWGCWEARREVIWPIDALSLFLSIASRRSLSPVVNPFLFAATTLIYIYIAEIYTTVSVAARAISMQKAISCAINIHRRASSLLPLRHAALRPPLFEGLECILPVFASNLPLVEFSPDIPLTLILSKYPHHRVAVSRLRMRDRKAPK